MDNNATKPSSGCSSPVVSRNSSFWATSLAFGRVISLSSTKHPSPGQWPWSIMWSTLGGKDCIIITAWSAWAWMIRPYTQWCRGISGYFFARDRGMLKKCWIATKQLRPSHSMRHDQDLNQVRMLCFSLTRFHHWFNYRSKNFLINLKGINHRDIYFLKLSVKNTFQTEFEFQTCWFPAA